MNRLGVAFEAKEVNVFEPPAEFFTVNPLGLVPVLLVNPKPGIPSESFGLPDSSTILEYLHENYGERIWPKDLASRARARAASTLAEGLMTETVK